MVEQKALYRYRKRGVYYFCRPLPEDLTEHYKQSKIAFSLRTKSSRNAKIKAASLSSQLDEDWLAIRWRTKHNRLRRFLKYQALEARSESTAPFMSEAKEYYFRVKGIDTVSSLIDLFKIDLSYPYWPVNI